MKNIFFAFMLFASIKATSQIPVQITVPKGNLADTEFVNKKIASIPLTSGGTSVTKQSLGLGNVDNTSDLNKPVSLLQQAAITSLQQQINNKADKGATTTTGGAAFPATVNLPDQTWLIKINTTTTGQTYSNGTQMGAITMGGYKTNTGVNYAKPDRPDVVWTTMAYNIAIPNGGRNRAVNDAALELMTAEIDFDNYSNALGFKPGDFELHNMREYDLQDGEHRWYSVYGNKWDGSSRHDFEANSVNWMYGRKGKIPQLYASLQEATFDLYAGQAGRAVGFTATDFDGTALYMKEIGGVGFFKVPGVLDADGYGKKNILFQNVKTYNSTAEAKADGIIGSFWLLKNGDITLAKVQ